jgi:CubicO group peptidase (beta-lactamase class C family)
MTTDTLFWIASCTKAVTCVAAMQLVEDGRLGLDDPVGRWLPQLAEPKRLEGFDEAGQPILSPAKAPITLRRLLSHTSGLAYGFTSAALDRYITATGVIANGPNAPDLPLVFEPGEGWIYGVGIDWAGKLVEAVSGEAFDATLRGRRPGGHALLDAGDALLHDGRRRSLFDRLGLSALSRLGTGRRAAAAGGGNPGRPVRAAGRGP